MKKIVFSLVILTAFLCNHADAQPFTITTFAGCGNCFPPNNGDLGSAVNAYLPGPSALAFDASGNLYIADAKSSSVRKVALNGTITTVAGTSPEGFYGDGGLATLAGLTAPNGVAVDSIGNIYISDSLNNRIRKVTSDGKINTIVGGGKGCVGQSNSLGDGCQATSANLGTPSAVALDATGNLYITDTNNNRIRKVSSAGIISTIAGGGSSSTVGDGGPATQAYIGFPSAIALDGAGNLYICCGGNRVRKVSPSGIISTVAGNGTEGFKGDGGSALIAELDGGSGLAVDVAGNLYISDKIDYRIRQVNLAGTITTIAGGGSGCGGQLDTIGDGCPASSSQLNYPQGLTIDSAGNLYVADQFNFRVRLLNPGTAISLAANAFGDTALIAPNTWVEIKGSHLASSGDVRAWQTSDFANNQLPTQLDGVSVTVNGKKAFVYYISGTQVNILTPPDAITGSVQVQLTNGAISSPSVTVQAQQYSPSFFVFDGSHVTGTHLDGSLLGPTTLYPGLSSPAKPGETVILYGNGFGPTSVPIVSGSETQAGSLPTMPVVKIGGSAATVQFAGLVSPGLYQFNVVVPSAAQDGDNPLTATYNGSSVQAGVVIAVEH